MQFSIVPTHLAVKAMRDNGYKNAAYALAELMDNSIQAGARNVELLCAEKIEQLPQRQRRRIYQVAVLDDAQGMDRETLRIALQFGNGTRLDPSDQDGIGRFGMGLPASSISQCQRVDVWTWQDGPEKALFTYLDLDEIADQTMTDVPEPTHMPLPEAWRKVGQSWGKSGTLVVWSKLDRIVWRTAKALFDNSEFIIGRMYRRFLADGRVDIRFAAFDEDNVKSITLDTRAKPNDPGYLMIGTSTPAPWDNQAMFAPFGEEISIHHVKFNGQVHEVKIRYSLAVEAARQGYNPGSRPYGQHARRNMGLSIVRADRELELDDGWCDPSAPTDRWWGIEVEFPPALDEVFGVTNNKQHAHNFSEFANVKIEDLIGENKSFEDLRSEMEDDEDPRAPLLDIVNRIQKNRSVMRSLLKAQTATEDRRIRKRHTGGDSPESRATEATRDRKGEGHQGRSDVDESLPKEEREKQLGKELEAQGLPEGAAKEIAARTILDGLKYVFAEADLETPAFFSVKPKGGSIIITLNTSHPAYSSLVEVLERDPADEGIADLRARLQSAEDGLKLLLMAWARYEDELPDGPQREKAQETRVHWGQLARKFLRSDG